MKQGTDLRGLIGYQIQRAHLLMGTDARAALAPFDLSPAKFTALLMIRDNPGCDQTALGRALSVNRSSAMKLVNILEDRGLVERRAGRDLRTNALFLRPKGEAQIGAMVKAVHQSDARMTRQLSQDEAAHLLALLGKISAEEDMADSEADTGIA